jgi:hypothetical protein
MWLGKISGQFGEMRRRSLTGTPSASKIPISSKYPTFALTYTKGIKNLLGSDVDFDKWNFDIYDNASLRLAGSLNYYLSVGGFLNNKQVMIQDYKHLNSNNIKASIGKNNFRLLSSYIRSNTSHFYSEIHLEHHLNGLITNKIPYIRKKNWNLVGAAHQFMISSKDYYGEYSVGIENIMKIFRIDYVTAVNNGKYQSSSFVLGLGGLLGSGISAGSSGQSANNDRSGVQISF